jgi:single-strand DNA-binding protein
MYTDSGVISTGAELKYLPDGTAICNWSMAIKQRGETMWLKCTTFGKAAETANQWLTKGKHIMVTGHLQFDKETGNPRIFTRRDGSAGASFEIVVQDWKFVGGKSDGDTQAQAQSTPTAEVNDDDIPF